jgi:uncharacterized protein YdeI (YjbR/CyaY-like superfamily)
MTPIFFRSASEFRRWLEKHHELQGQQEGVAVLHAQPPGYRRLIVFMVMSAKQDETRERRLDRVMKASEKGLGLI